MSPQELVATVLLGTGISFVAVGAIGFVRLPDVFCRLHVTGIMDTLGAPLILLGVAVHLGAQLVSLKLLLVIVFLVLSSPLVGHLLARAALEAGQLPRHLEDEFELDQAAPGGRGP